MGRSAPPPPPRQQPTPTSPHLRALQAMLQRPAPSSEHQQGWVSRHPNRPPPTSSSVAKNAPPPSERTRGRAGLEGGCPGVRVRKRMAHLAHISAHSPHEARVKRHESAVRKRTLDAERHCTRSCGQRRTLRHTHLQHRWEAAALMELVRSGWHLRPPLCTASTAARAAPNRDAHCHSNRVRQVQSGVRPRTAKQRSVAASKMLEIGCRPPQRRQPPSREPKPPLVRHTADLWNGGHHNTERVSDRPQHYMLLPLSTPTQPPPPPLHHKQPPPPPLPRQTKMECHAQTQTGCGHLHRPQLRQSTQCRPPQQPQEEHNRCQRRANMPADGRGSTHRQVQRELMAEDRHSLLRPQHLRRRSTSRLHTLPPPDQSLRRPQTQQPQLHRSRLQGETTRRQLPLRQQSQQHWRPTAHSRAENYRVSWNGQSYPDTKCI